MFGFLARLFGGSRTAAPSPRQFVAERDPDAPVLDVRTAAEFASGHVTRAINVDVTAPDFAPRVQALLARGTLKKDGTVYLYCRSGNRSARAEALLRSLGFTAPQNVGAFGALRAAGAEVE